MADGATFKKCACKGIRTCLLCEGSGNHKAEVMMSKLIFNCGLGNFSIFVCGKFAFKQPASTSTSRPLLVDEYLTTMVFLIYLQDEKLTKWLFCAQCCNKASRSNDHVTHRNGTAEMLDIQGGLFLPNRL